MVPVAMVQSLTGAGTAADDDYKALAGEVSAGISPSGNRRPSRPDILVRDYLVRQMTPSPEKTHQSGPPSPPTTPSWDKICDNTNLHNAQCDNLTTADSRNSVLRPLEEGSQRTGVFTLVATALGAGVLTLPYAFSRTGLVVGLFVLVAAFCVSCVSLVILMMASRYAEVDSYGALLALATGSQSVRCVVDACVVGYGFAIILALLMFEGDFVPAIFEGCGLARPGRAVAIIGVAAAVTPCVIPAKVSALRYMSLISPVAIFYIAGTVLYQAPHFYAARPEDSNPKLVVPEPLQILQSMCIFVFSAMCHTNAVPVANSLDRPSVVRIVKVAMYTNIFLFVLYVAIGIGGYMSFQAFVQGDFLLSYPNSSVSILVCRMMMATICYVAIPMNSSNCVPALQRLLAAVMHSESQVEVKKERPLAFAMLAMALLSVATIAAIYCTNVATVLSLVGGSLTTLQMFWFPGYIYWKLLYPSQSAGFRNFVMITMISSGVAGFSSVLATVGASLL